jgi:hypothetical protein
MAYQTRLDNDTTPLILSDSSDVRNETLASIQGRVTPILYGTVMARVAADRRWVPWNNVLAVDGSALPRGIYLGDEIAAADIAAEHIDDVPILVGNARVNEEKVVFDDDVLSANSIIGAGGIAATTGRDCLMMTANIRLQLGVAISEHEN